MVAGGTGVDSGAAVASLQPPVGAGEGQAGDSPPGLLCVISAGNL